MTTIVKIFFSSYYSHRIQGIDRIYQSAVLAFGSIPFQELLHIFASWFKYGVNNCCGWLSQSQGASDLWNKYFIKHNIIEVRCWCVPVQIQQIYIIVFKQMTWFIYTSKLIANVFHNNSKRLDISIWWFVKCHRNYIYFVSKCWFLAATKQLYKWYFPSVCPSVCPSVRHTFLTIFPSSYHHEIFRSHYQWPT